MPINITLHNILETQEGMEIDKVNSTKEEQSHSTTNEEIRVKPSDSMTKDEMRVNGSFSFTKLEIIKDLSDSTTKEKHSNSSLVVGDLRSDSWHDSIFLGIAILSVLVANVHINFYNSLLWVYE